MHLRICSRTDNGQVPTFSPGWWARRRPSWSVLLRFVAVGALAVGGPPQFSSATTFNWSGQGEFWGAQDNWNPLGVPNGVDDSAVLGDVLASPQTILLSTNFFVNGIVFDSPHSYTIDSIASGMIAFGSPGNAPASIDVLQGDHSIDVGLAATTTHVDIDVSTNSTLSLDRLTAGDTGFDAVLTKTGGGDLRLNQVFSLNDGKVVGLGGSISGNGEIFGNLENLGATVAPGNNNIGALFVMDDYSQGSNATLRVELSGTMARQHDLLAVLGSAALKGEFVAVQDPLYSPVVGDQLTVMTYGSKTGAFDTISLPGSPSPGHEFDAIVGTNDLKIKLGQTVSWAGGGGIRNWNVASFWNSSAIPDSNSVATLSKAGTTKIQDTVVAPILGLKLSEGRILDIEALAGAAALDVAGTVQLESAAGLRVEGTMGHLQASTIQNAANVIIRDGASIDASHRYTQVAGFTTMLDGTLTADVVQIQGGTLTGFGNIVGDLVVGQKGGSSSILSPGFGVGTISVIGDLQLQPTAELTIAIDTSGPTVVADQLAISGMASLGGTLNLNLTGSGGIPFDEAVEILLADDFSPGTSFDEFNISSSIEEALVVSFLPPGGPTFDAGMRVYTSKDPGDMFTDGIIDGKDARLFAWAIRDIHTYREKFFLSDYAASVCEFVSGPCGIAEEKLADIDGDDEYTFADIQGFLDLVDELGGSRAAALSEIVSVFNQTAVPEPATLWLVITLLASSVSLCRQR